MDRKIRILMLSGNYYPVPGGQSEQATLLAETLVENGYLVEVISQRQSKSLSRKENINGVSVYRLPQPSRTTNKRLFRRNIWGLLLFACRLSIRMIFGNHRYDLCIIRTISSYAFVSGFLRACSLIRYRTIITAETGGENDEISYLSGVPFSKVIVFYMRKNDFFNCNNSENARHFLELGFPQNRITKIYNGVDTREYSNCLYPEKITTFLFLAELNREKGVRELLDAFVLVRCYYPEVKLIIGGYGDEEKFIRNYIRTNNLKGAVNFVGYVTREQKRAFYEKGDCFVFPSYSEGFGLVVAEAVSYKRVVITTQVGDLPSILGNKVFYCRERDCRDLAEKMKDAIDSYRLSAMNYDSVISMLSINRTLKEFIALYYRR